MTKEARVPGLWLRRLAERVCERDRLERVVLPALADLQHECGDGASFVVRLRAYWGVWKAMAICTLADGCHRARPTCSNVAKRMAVIIPLVMCAVVLPSVNSAFDGRNSPTVVLLTLSPQAFAAALLVALFLCRHTRAMANVAASVAAGHLRHVGSLHGRHADLHDDDRAAREPGISIVAR